MSDFFVSLLTQSLNGQKSISSHLNFKVAVGKNMYQSLGMYQSNFAQHNVTLSPLEYIAHSAQSGDYQNSYLMPIQSTCALFQPSISFTSYGMEEQLQHKTYNVNQNYKFLQTRQEYHFIPDNFLKPGKEGIFVGETKEIKEHIQEAFQKTMGEPFPSHIKISICGEKQFRKLAPSPATVGLSVNRSQHDLLSEIFVLNNYLGRIMLTIGHELGHVLTASLDTPQDEEAKAYAFSLAWMEVIKKHNIANLREAIVLDNPARNGLHDAAFDFVMEQKKEKEAWEIYLELVGKELSLGVCKQSTARL